MEADRRMARIATPLLILWFVAAASAGCGPLDPLEYAAYKRALGSNTRPALAKFIADYPQSRHREEIAGALTQLDARIRRLHSESFDHLFHRRVAEAAALLGELVQLSPNDQIALNNLGLATLLKGDIARATELFERTMDKTNPDCCKLKDVVLFAVYSTKSTGRAMGVLGAVLPSDADASAIDAAATSSLTSYLFLKTGDVAPARLSAYIPQMRTALDAAVNNAEAFKNATGIVPVMLDVERGLDDGRREDGILLPPSSKIEWRDPPGPGAGGARKD